MTQTANTIEICRRSRLDEPDGLCGLGDDSDKTLRQIIITVNLNSPESADAYLSSLEMLTRAFRAEMNPVPEETISTIVAMWVPKRPVPSMLLRQAKMLAQAKTEILQSNDWVTASEVSGLAQFKSSNPSSQPNKWKQSGKIFALRHEGVDYFPIYGLDPANGYRPITGLEDVVTTLASMKDGWAMAFWFASPNNFLGGKRPKDVILVNPKGVLEASREEVCEVMHG